MLDFLRITQALKKGRIEIFPKFVIGKTKDLMIRGGEFYAIWCEDIGLWSTDPFVAQIMIDQELDRYYEEHKNEYDTPVKVMHMWDGDTGTADKWKKFCEKQMPDNFHPLDEKIIFSDTITSRTDYASRRVPYPLVESPIPAYDRLMSKLYSPEERHKIEWAIGSIVSGDSKKNQKFLVLYGESGTGKSTVLNIIQDLFEGYWVPFDAKALGSANASYALEPFSGNPLVAIQHDGDLSRIEDNTRLNSIVSHEEMVINEKFKSLYSAKFNCFLFMGTNKPVKITDSRSGILRRLIDVSPTGDKLSKPLYLSLTSQIKFELGGIAKHCLDVYLEDPAAYDNYVPSLMLGASNDFYNFMLEYYESFTQQNSTTLKQAWEYYKRYCEESNSKYPLSKTAFKEELRSYFTEYKERTRLDDGTQIRNYYRGFKRKKFEYEQVKVERMKYIRFEYGDSIFDQIAADYPAQYANENEVPSFKWDNVTTTLKDIDTSKLHYVRVPENHIVIDFDLKDKDGNKSFEKNLAAASQWPETYSELSKSGQGIHLHYIYDGDVEKLARMYADDIEIKIFTGKTSLRRKLTKCNNAPIATINSGLPLKGEIKLVNQESIKSELGLRSIIQRNLNKEIHGATKPSIDFIFKILEDAYNSGLKYDVSDMRPQIIGFAANSTNHSEYCVRLVSQMKFSSEEASEPDMDYKDDTIIFFDVEVFLNLFLINWKRRGKEHKVVRMINPKPEEVEDLMRHKLVGFNCRRYDNHILYARMMGYSNEQLFKVSQRIIRGDKDAFFGEAYNVSYTDVYDFSSKKQSLKKFEIELGLHHQELGLPWDQPVPEDQWIKVAEYCDNDVIATEAVFEARYQDFVAREILADIAGSTVNDTTNNLTTKIIFGKERNPQKDFVYTDLSTIFPGYSFEAGHSSYRGEDPGEGGYVYSEPGMYTNVALLDVASMHPTSIEQLNLFGPYTKNFSAIKQARIAIKHKDYILAGQMFDGKLAKYLKDDEQASALSYALKIAINSVYGLTSAKFDNKCRDPRNIDNIVAKRGALFMINLKHEVQDRGFTVAHIKTDSIKIPDATPEIIQFVMDYGKKYGYDFEHEATYERMCLVNDAVYVARYSDGDHKFELPSGQVVKTPWTATGTQFQVPYVFKSLFSHDEIEFPDLCETKTVTTALYLDMNEGLPDGEHDYHFVGKAGQFCPIEKGKGGGILYREKDGKYYSATGAKGYRWLESEMVKVLGKENDIDRSYYEKLCADARISIAEFGDYEWFVSE